MAYVVNYSNPAKTAITIAEGILDGPSHPTRALDITLIGKNKTNYGEVQNENFLHLMEHFAHPQVSPGTPNSAILTTPVEGQLWYNSTTKSLYLYNGTSWGVLSITVGTSTPAPAITGDLWYDTSIPQLKVYNGTSFVSASSRYLQLDGTVAMTGALNAGGNKITNLATPTAAGDAVSKGYGDSTYLKRTTDTFSGILTIAGDVIAQGRITFYDATSSQVGHVYKFISGTNQLRVSLGNASTAATSAFVFGYESVYNTPSSFVPTATLTGNGALTVSSLTSGSASFTGQVNLNNNKIINLATPTASGDAVSKAYVDGAIGAVGAAYVDVTGDTMSGVLNMGVNKIINVASPTLGFDAANKTYVDTLVTNNSSAVVKNLPEMSQGGINLQWFMYITSQNKLVSQGANHQQVLGAGTTPDISSFKTPSFVALPFNKTPIQCGVGRQWGMALCSDNSLYTWGYNAWGQLGNNTTANSPVPVNIFATSDTIQYLRPYATNGSISAVVTITGRIFVWGYNGYGGLGDGSTTNRLTPIELLRISGQNWKDITGTGEVTYAWTDDATGNKLYACGRNTWGQLMDGTTTNRTTLVACTRASDSTQIQGVKKVIASSATNSEALSVQILCNNGDLYTAGYNASGQVGDGTTVNKSRGVLVLTGVNDVVTTNGDDATVVALMNDGSLKSWGGNPDGQQGLGDTANRSTPTIVKSAGLTGITITGVTKIFAPTYETRGYVHFLKNDGSVWAAGYNNYGNLGVGDTNSRLIFTQVFTPEIITDIRYATYYDGSNLIHTTYFLGESKHLYACGHNGWGELGSGDIMNWASTPKLVLIPTGPIPSAAPSNQAEFGIAGTFPFVVPIGITSILVQLLVGAGGGGGGVQSNGDLYQGASGGSGGYHQSITVPVTAGETLTVTIGAGGNNGVVNFNGANPGNINGTNGGNTVLLRSATPLLTATGGGGGTGGGTGSNQPGAGGTPNGVAGVSGNGFNNFSARPGGQNGTGKGSGGYSNNGIGGNGPPAGHGYVGQSGYVLISW